MGARKRVFTGRWGWGCPGKRKADRLEMPAGHGQYGAWLDKNFLICLFDGIRNVSLFPRVRQEKKRTGSSHYPFVHKIVGARAGREHYPEKDPQI